jgi:hypothetical protein
MSIAAVGVALCAPQSVGDATIHATIVGTIKTGTDYNGVFVGQNAPLARFPFTAIFTFDPNGGVANGNQTTCTNGRIASGLNTPVTDVKLIINDKTYEFNTKEAADFSGSLVSSAAGTGSPKMQLTFIFIRTLTENQLVGPMILLSRYTSTDQVQKNVEIGKILSTTCYS